MFTGGSFSLSSVTYSGSSADSYNSSDSNASLWTGSYSGSQSATSAQSASNSENVSAAGSFVGGSWSLSSYALSGSAQLSDADSDQWQQSLPSSVGGSGTFASSDASAGSSSLYQSGTEAAGAYSNGSYSYLDGSGATMTAEVPSGSSMTSDTWTQQSATTATLGGTQQQQATAAYSYHAPTSSNTLTNSGSSMAAAIPSTAVVQFADPDPTVVAAADVAQMVPTPSIGGGTSAAPTASGTSQLVGSASIGGMAPGATAPVPITVNMQLIADTADWVNTTQQAPPQVTTTSIYNSTLHGWQPAAAAAMSDLQKRVDGVNFAMTVYSTVVVPAMNTAKWLQGSSIGGGLLSSLMLSDTSGEFANAYARTNQAEFSSSSSDPLGALGGQRAVQ